VAGRLPDISSLLAERVASGAMAACSAAVVRGDDSRIYALGDAGCGVPVSTSTLFHICSCSKAFTAAAFANLVDQGVASWDMPVRAIVPEFVLADAGIANACTMRDLGGMRLGLSREGIAEWGFRPDAPVTDRLQRARAMAFEAPFRSRFCYSNIGYITLALATARLAQTDYARSMQELVFAPAGLRHAAMQPAASDAKPHLPVGGKLTPVPDLTGDNSQGSARVHLSADDGAGWLAYMLRSSRGDSGAAISEIFQPQIGNPAVDSGDGLPVAHAYGFGWNLSTFRGRRLFNHGGGGRGWRAMALLDPERDTGVMVCGSHEGAGVEALALTLLDIMRGDEPKDWEALLRARAMRDVRARNAAKDLRGKPEGETADPRAMPGVYENPMTGKVHIERDAGGTLHFAAEDAPAFGARLMPLSNDILEFRFENPALHRMPNDPLFEARFLRGPQGSTMFETTYFGMLERAA
jgi:CubicO group peptidase (beta-lactamase class C family)